MKSNVSENLINEKKIPDNFRLFLEKLRSDYKKTELCNHPHSCVSHSVEVTSQLKKNIPQLLQSFAKNMTFGLTASSVLTVIRNVRTIIKNPLNLITLLVSKENLKLPLFAGFLPFIFNVSLLDSRKK